MIIIEQIPMLLELLLAVALIILFFYSKWQLICIDITRQQLFRIRDDIFLYADDGRIDFNDKNYIEIRNRLNSSIKYCHKIKLSTLFSIILLQKNKQISDEFNQQELLTDIVKNIEDTDLRHDLEKQALEVTFFLSALVILRSPILLLFIMFAIPVILITQLLGGHIKKLVLDVGKLLERDIIYDKKYL